MHIKLDEHGTKFNYQILLGISVLKFRICLIIFKLLAEINCII